MTRELSYADEGLIDLCKARSELRRLQLRTNSALIGAILEYQRGNDDLCYAELFEMHWVFGLLHDERRRVKCLALQASALRKHETIVENRPTTVKARKQ